MSLYELNCIEIMSNVEQVTRVATTQCVDIPMLYRL